MLVRWQEVDNNWRNSANRQSEKIHSHGLFTNIEQALKDAMPTLKLRAIGRAALFCYLTVWWI